MLLVPQEIRRAINHNSGYISSNSKYGRKNLKGLFLLDENRQYLAKELFSLITSPEYVKDTMIASGMPIAGLATLLKRFQPAAVANRIQELIEGYPLPYREDELPGNPVLQLSNLNKDFLLITSKTLIASPDSLVIGYYDIDPDSGNTDIVEWDYGAASYSDGTWHPEHLFTESKRNRANPNWKPFEVNFDTNPPAGISHARRPPRGQIHYRMDESKDFKRTKYEPHNKEQFIPVPGDNGRGYLVDQLSGTTRTELAPIDNIFDLVSEPLQAPGPGNKYRYDHWGDNGFSTGGTFPRWQTSVNDRPYQRDTAETLREGGTSDRRVQRPHGYDMSALRSKSTA
jgi:hypothetical protein